MTMFIGPGCFRASKEELVTGGLSTCSALAFRAAGMNFLAHVDPTTRPDHVATEIVAKFDLDAIRSIDLVPAAGDAQDSLRICIEVVEMLGLSYRLHPAIDMMQQISISVNGLSVNASEAEAYLAEERKARAENLYTSQNTRHEPVRLEEAVGRNILVVGTYVHRGVYQVRRVDPDRFDNYAFEDSEGGQHHVYIPATATMWAIDYREGVSAEQFYATANRVFLQDLAARVRNTCAPSPPGTHAAERPHNPPTTGQRGLG